jgi:RecB family exonuclease
LHLRGVIDRIDIENGRTVVRDLKTGRAHLRRGRELEPDPLLDVQIAIYGMVARTLATQWSIPSDVGAAYVYAGSLAEAERDFRADFSLLEASARHWLIIAGQFLASGAFPRTPIREDCTYCAFEPVCGRNPHERAVRLLTEAGGPFAEFRAFREKLQDEPDE